MITISGLTIRINKGNSAGFQLQLTGEDVPENGTIVSFRVRKNEHYETPVIEKLIPVNEGLIDIDLYSYDTEFIEPGEYHWNLTILYEDGTNPWTLFETAPLFVILPKDGRCGV